MKTRLITRTLMLALMMLVSMSAVAQYVMCTGNNVRLRYGPSTNAPMLKYSNGRPVYMNKGQKLTYIGRDTYDFYNVQYNGQSVYISKDFSRLVYNTPNPNTNTRSYVVVNGTNVRLRYGPSLNADIYRNSRGAPIFPQKGMRLTYAGQTGDWYKVYYDGRIFYISKQHCYLR